MGLPHLRSSAQSWRDYISWGPNNCFRVWHAEAGELGGWRGGDRGRQGKWPPESQFSLQGLESIRPNLTMNFEKLKHYEVKRFSASHTDGR